MASNPYMIRLIWSPFDLPNSLWNNAPEIEKFEFNSQHQALEPKSFSNWQKILWIGFFLISIQIISIDNVAINRREILWTGKKFEAKWMNLLGDKSYKELRLEERGEGRVSRDSNN